jgi:hypothetical protein
VEIILKNKFIDIATHFSEDISASLSMRGEYFVWGECGFENNSIPIKTDFKSFNEILCD